MTTARAYIGLGANLGAAAQTLQQACTRIAALPRTRVLQRSPLYRSAPVDAAGPDFCNAVVALDTALEPLALLQALQAIEHAFGRQRPYPNAPRTLDLDLLLYGELVRVDAMLTLPHPRLAARRFVLQPLHDIAPALEVPGVGTVADLLAQVRDQGLIPLPPQDLPHGWDD